MARSFYDRPGRGAKPGRGAFVLQAATMSAPPLTRRPELTFRENLRRGRHGWLRLTPAYSVRLVEDLLDACEPGARILDPFSGTGTTPLCAAERGCAATSVDVNPFLVWLGNAKLRRYAPATRAAVARAVDSIARDLDAAPLADEPPIHRIERWWSPEARLTLRRLKGAIEAAALATPGKDLLRVALCRVLIELSNAAFDHPSMSFGDGAPKPRVDGRALFVATAQAVLEGAAAAPRGRGRVLLGDARDLEALGEARFDRVLTSPPYPNRMSYIRELRPYMYWLDHLRAPAEAGELDWRAIGGTWGVATSRLARFEPSPDAPAPPALRRARDAIERAHPRNGPLLARYLDRYFEDVFAHLRALRAHLAPGAGLDYVVGNSVFYGVLVPVERIYQALLAELGYRDVGCVTVRKRNSKKALFEYRVHARAQ
jgi:hypothetical protein